MTDVAHDTLKTTPPKPKDEKQPSTPPPAEFDRTGLALRWAAVFIGAAALVAVAVLAITSANESEPEVVADSVYVLDTEQLAARVPEGFAPTGTEIAAVTLIPYNPATRTALVPAGYAPTGRQAPELTLVVPGGETVRLVLPEGFVPVSGT